MKDYCTIYNLEDKMRETKAQYYARTGVYIEQGSDTDMLLRQLVEDDRMRQLRYDERRHRINQQIDREVRAARQETIMVWTYTAAMVIPTALATWLLFRLVF